MSKITFVQLIDRELISNKEQNVCNMGVYRQTFLSALIKLRECGGKKLTIFCFMVFATNV